MTLAGRVLSIAIPGHRPGGARLAQGEDREARSDRQGLLGLRGRPRRVFRDPRGGGESGLIRRVLEYLETPQYLRRRLFPLDESLKYAGLLPPLRIPSHKPKVPVASPAPRRVQGGRGPGRRRYGGRRARLPARARESRRRSPAGAHREDNHPPTTASGRPGRERSADRRVLGLLRRGEERGGGPRRFPLRAEDSHLASRRASRRASSETSASGVSARRSIMVLFGSPVPRPPRHDQETSGERSASS